MDSHSKIAALVIFLMSGNLLIASVSDTEIKKNAEQKRMEIIEAKKNWVCKGTLCISQSTYAPATAEVHNLIAEEAVIKGLGVYINMKSTGWVRFEGPVLITDSTLKGKVIVTSPFISLNKSTVETIVCNGDVDQTIELQDTLVEGSIEFESKRGIVILGGGSVIKGQVIGGTVIK